MPSFEEYITAIKHSFAALHVDSISQKTINYGQQLTLCKGRQKVVLSIYNGKKGRKLVWGGNSEELKNAASALLTEENPLMNDLQIASVPTEAFTLLAALKDFDYLWVGSDESGKGDFFGPLVVAAVMVNKDIAKKLLNFGVRDSKALTDGKIAELAKKIEAIAPLHTVLALTPEMYNLRYTQLQAEHKNLNNLLAYGHAQALNQTLAQNEKCKFALVDRFTQNNAIEKLVKSKFPLVTVVQQPKAEADMAVAAASILARAKFVEIMAKLSALAGCTLPKGGGAQATQCAQELLLSHDRAFLRQLVKEHFANYKTLI